MVDPGRRDTNGGPQWSDERQGNPRSEGLQGGGFVPGCWHCTLGRDKVCREGESGMIRTLEKKDCMRLKGPGRD